jgi:hypothetical protein
VNREGAEPSSGSERKEHLEYRVDDHRLLLESTGLIHQEEEERQTAQTPVLPKKAFYNLGQTLQPRNALDSGFRKKAEWDLSIEHAGPGAITPLFLPISSVSLPPAASAPSAAKQVLGGRADGLGLDLRQHVWRGEWCSSVAAGWVAV